ncbi:MAG: type II toxin-antitoxin system PemK/MazF family toxin [Gammaproteobacteria bacterium]
MAIIFHPKPGLILLCDFSQGFKAPEMVKSKRPVIVLTGAIRGRANLVTVVPLSTVEPTPPQCHHYKIPKPSMPMIKNFQRGDSWVKGDMVYTIGFHRLNAILLGKRGSDGKREYFKHRLGGEQMREIYRCILYGLNLGHLGEHL